MKLGLLFPALFGLSVGVASLDCKLPVSPSDVQTVLTAEQLVCVLAADFIPGQDAETVLKFCGYVGPITREVIEYFNSLVSARPKVWVDPITHAHLKAEWKRAQKKDAAPE